MILHRHKVTPYLGEELYGVVEKVVVGRLSYEHWALSIAPAIVFLKVKRKDNWELKCQKIVWNRAPSPAGEGWGEACCPSGVFRKQKTMKWKTYTGNPDARRTLQYSTPKFRFSSIYQSFIFQRRNDVTSWLMLVKNPHISLCGTPTSARGLMWRKRGNSPKHCLVFPNYGKVNTDYIFTINAK